MRTLLAALPLVALLAVPRSATALGTFLVRDGGTVAQTVSTTVIHLDSDPVETRLWIQVAYQGERANFGWLLPVSEAPTSVSTLPAFVVTGLAFQTAPRFELFHQNPDGICRSAVFSDDELAQAPPLRTLRQLDQAPARVENTRIEKFSSGQDAHAWLISEGFVVTPSARTMIDAAVADGMHLVLVDVISRNEVGDIQPLDIRLPGLHPSLPIRSLAPTAFEDVDVTVMTLSEGRAVAPAGVVTTELNLARYDWAGKLNYRELVTAAAAEFDEAAYQLESATSAPGSLNPYAASNLDEDAFLSEFPAPTSLLRLGGPHRETARVLARFINRNLYPGRSLEEIADLGVVELMAQLRSVDTSSAAEAVWAEIAQPLLEADRDLQRFSRLQRHYSVLRPEHMTEDLALGETAATEFFDSFRATRTPECGVGGQINEAFRLSITDGDIELESRSANLDLDRLNEMPAVRRARKDGAVIVDNDDAIASAVADYNAEFGFGFGCRCAKRRKTGLPWGGLMLIVGLLMFWGRRHLRRSAVLLGVLVLGSGCVSVNPYQSARTLDPGELSHTIAVSSYHQQAVGLSGAPIVGYRIRLGVMDGVEVAGRAELPGKVQLSAKLNPIRSKYFDLAVAPAVGGALYPHNSKPSNNGSGIILTAELPLVVDVNLGESVRLVPWAGPALVYSGDAEQTGYLARAGFGVEFLVGSVLIHPEVSIAWDPVRRAMMELNAGIGVTFGAVN